MGLILSKFICGVLGAIYPGYMSYKAVKNRDIAEYKRWMKYWIVYSFFTVAEEVLDWFAALLPLYYEIKIIFVLYMMLPQTRGSDMVFDHFLMPLLNDHEDTIDSGIEEYKAVATRKVSDVADEARRRTSSLTMETISALNQLIASNPDPANKRSSGLAQSTSAEEIAAARKRSD